MLAQLTLAEFIRTGDHERHIRRQRREYARRRAFLQRMLRDAGHDVPGIAAGLHALIPVSAAPDATAGDIGGTRAGSVAVHALSRYTRSHSHPPALVAGFATPSRARFEASIDALVALVRAR